MGKKGIQKSEFALLAEHVDAVFGTKSSYAEDHPMVRYFRIILTEEEAKYTQYVNRIPRTARAIAEENNLPVEKTKEILWSATVKGVCFAEFVKEEPYYCSSTWAPGIIEYMVKHMNDNPEIAKCFLEYGDLSAGQVKLMNPNDGGMRVIPVMKEIEAQAQALTYEQVLAYLDQKFYAIDDVNHEHPLEPIFSCADCACRTAKKVTGESMFLCNCCGCSCGVLSGNFKYGGNGGTKSNYKPVINPENCVACGACVEKCPANAIRLGDRLCTPDKDQVEVYETCEEFAWGESKWNYDYREHTFTTSAGTAPCKTACPAHIPVQGYIRKVSEGDYRGALEVIKRENPFPAVCGRICPHPCEAACSRNKIDEAVAIDEIKMFVADKDREQEHRFIPEIKEFHPQKIAIIGAGPAGLTCAYYLAVKGYQITVFEKRKTLGGMLTNGLPSFRLEKDVISAEIDIIKEMGVQFVTGTEVGKDVSIQELREQGFEGFYVAIGAQKAVMLGLENENLPDVMGGVDFLNLVNNGEVSLSGKVIVVGGGNVAIDVARSAIRCGAEKVDLYCLESEDEMPALLEERKEAMGEGVEIHNGWGPKEIIAANDKVKAVQFKKCVSVKDGAGRFNPKYNEKNVIEVQSDTVLLAIGQAIDLGALFTGEDVKVDNRGRIIVDEKSYQTNVFGHKEVFSD